MLIFFFSGNFEEVQQNINVERNCFLCIKNEKSMLYDCGHVKVCEACSDDWEKMIRWNQELERINNEPNGLSILCCPFCRKPSKKPVMVKIWRFKWNFILLKKECYFIIMKFKFIVYYMLIILEYYLLILSYILFYTSFTYL